MKRPTLGRLGRPRSGCASTDISSYRTDQPAPPVNTGIVLRLEGLEPRLLLSPDLFGMRLDFAVAAEPIHILTGMFDGDDQLDLALTSRKDDAVSVLYGEGGGSFSGLANFEVGSQHFAMSRTPGGMVAEDFNNDAGSTWL